MSVIKIKILNECGYHESLLGLSLNKNQDVKNMPTIAKKLCMFDGGHNKFLESIYVWLDVTAPRYWWQEADTYRVATKQSQSTMHTILKNKLTQDNFESRITPNYLKFLNDILAEQDLTKLKTYLPEGFLQRRIWVVNYNCLRNIINQRKNHRLKHWQIFCGVIKNQVKHPELLPDIKE